MLYTSHWLVWNEELHRWRIMFYFGGGPDMVVAQYRFKWLACLHLAWIMYRKDIFPVHEEHWHPGATGPSQKVLSEEDAVSKYIDEVLNRRSL